MADYKIVQPMFDELSRLIKESVAGNFQVIMQYISPLFGACMILYIVFVAWEIMYSRKDNIMMEALKNIGVFTIVCSLMTAGGMYLSEIVPFVQGSGQEIAGKIIGQNGSSTGSMIDGLINQLIKIGENEWEVLSSASWSDKVVVAITFALKIILLAICGGGFVVLCASYLLMAEMMVGILLSVGGVFIAFAAFPSTRQMFTAWVGSCLNYIFLSIAYACMFNILITYVKDYIGKDGGESVWGILCIALVFVIAKFLMSQISTLMSVLTGGVGINGLTSAVGGFNRSVMNGLGMGQGGVNRQRLMTGGRALRQQGVVGLGKSAAKAAKDWWNSPGKMKGG